MMEAEGKTSTGILIIFSGFSILCFAALWYEYKRKQARFWHGLALVSIVGGLAAILFPWYEMEARHEAHREWRRSHPHERRVWE